LTHTDEDDSMSRALKEICAWIGGACAFAGLFLVSCLAAAYLFPLKTE
jgi:hypothetical protein